MYIILGQTVHNLKGFKMASVKNSKKLSLVCEKILGKSIETVVFSNDQLGKIVLVTQFSPKTFKPDSVFWVYPNNGGWGHVDSFVDALKILTEQ